MSNSAFLDYCFGSITNAEINEELSCHEAFILGYASGRYGGIKFDKVIWLLIQVYEMMISCNTLKKSPKSNNDDIKNIHFAILNNKIKEVFLSI